MRRLPSALAPAGYSPNRLNPLSLAPVNDQGQLSTDIMAIQRMFASGEQGGYWPADPVYLYEDSAGTIPARVNGVVGLRVNYVTGKPNATQSTTANKPYLRKTPVSNKFWLDSNTATGALTATFASSLGSACTIATVGAEGVTIAENQTVGTTYNLCPPYGYNGDVLIINRALTSAEKALVNRVMQRNVPTLGSELVANGEFDIDTSNWSTSLCTLSVVDGKLRVTNTGGFGRAYQSFGTVNGQRYLVIVDFAGTVYGGVRVGLSATTPHIFVGPTLTVPATAKYIITTTSSLSYLQLSNAGTGGDAVGVYSDWDNVSIRSVL